MPVNLHLRQRPRTLSRRDFLGGLVSSAGAAGMVTPLAAMRTMAALRGGQLLAPERSHFPARAKQLIFVFLTGGFSHVDTFDPKPKLKAMHGQRIPATGLRPEEAKDQPLLGSPFEFDQCGASGLWISDLFPQLRNVADDLCVIRSMHTDIVEHFQATLAMHTGSSTVPMPSLGSWLSYGLGSLNYNLPSYVVLAEHLPYAGAQVFDAQFLPPHHQGVRVMPGTNPIPNLKSIASPDPSAATLQDLERQLLEDFDRLHASVRPDDLRLPARTATFQTARGMMQEAPDVLDASREPAAIREAYGLTDGDNTSLGWQCLMARRLIERGVRTVELIDTGSHDNWDSHGDMQAHRPKALRVDRALTALLLDLKARGLLDSTLVAICTEFGRTPWTDASNGKGRNHFAKAFTCLLSGAGVKGGITHGTTDELGSSILENPVHVHDYHATILHLLGLDHTRLTYRYGGRDFRLTDVAGEVIKPILT